MKKLTSLILLLCSLSAQAAYPSFQDITNLLISLGAVYTVSSNTNVVTALTITNSDSYLNGVYVPNPSIVFPIVDRGDVNVFYCLSNGAAIAQFSGGYYQWQIGTNQPLSVNTGHYAYVTQPVGATNTQAFPPTNSVWGGSAGTHPPFAVPTFQPVTNISFVYNPTNLAAGSNILFSISGYTITISGTPNTNALTAAQQGALASAVTNLNGGVLGVDFTTIPTLSGNNTFTGQNQWNNQMTFQDLFQSYGSDVTPPYNTITVNTEHLTKFSYIPYQSTTPANVWATLDSPNNSTLNLDLGGYGYGGAPASPGVTGIFFQTGTSSGGNSQRQWEIDGNGNLWPYQTASAVTLGTSSHQIPTEYVQTANDTNINVAGEITFNSATNFMSFSTTNNGPVSTNLIRWISVQISGDTNKWRIGLAR